MTILGCLRLRIWWGTPCRFDSCYPQYARQEAEAFSASFFYISLITMVEVPEIMIHYPYIRILSRYAIREKVTAGGK